MTLTWLDFDYSEDADGNGSFDAMASATPPQLPRLEAEVLSVLEWARQSFPGAQGPLESGGEWDMELQGVSEVASTLAVTPDLAQGKLRMEPRETAPPRVTLSVTLSGTPSFCEAFREAFNLD